MAFHVRDPETDILVRELARERGCGLTEAIRMAVTAELSRGRSHFETALRALQDEVAANRQTGRKADKAFYDHLWEGEV